MVSEILQSLLPYLGFGVFAVPILVYGAVKYAHGPTPEVRREGLDLMFDVLVGAVMFGVFTALINSSFFPQAVHTIASSVSVGNQTLASAMPSAGSPQQLLSWSANVSRHWFNKVTQWYGNFWGTTIGLSIVPITSPFGWYLQQSTWYLQTMVTYTITNLGFIYALSLIAEYAWGILGLAIGLLLIRQTRSIGTFILALALIALFVAPLLAAYTSIAMSHVYPQLNFLPNTNNTAAATLGNIAGVLTGVLWNQGFPAGLALQTYDVTVDVVLAFALAASYGLYRVLDETIVDVLPI
jgi:hypothetical protein